MTGATGRMVLVVAGLLVVLTYLLLRGATPDTALHERRLDALNALILNQAALHRDVLKARAGSLRNYDPLVSGVDGLRRAATELQSAVGMSAEIDRELKSLAAEVDEQEALVERFKSNNALLQNSLAYFAHVSHRLGARASADSPAVAVAVGALGNAMLGFLGDPSKAAAADLAASLDRVADLPVPGSLQEDSQGLVAHGRLVLEILPGVDEILARLFATRATQRARVMQDLFIDAFRRAESRAWTYRILLYGASVLLLAYLSHLYLRLRANARALAERSSALQARSEFEHLIAGISAQFIDLPHDLIGAGISQGLERLGRHAGVERAYIVLFGADGAAATDVYSWYREGATAPDGWLDAVPALESGWTLEGNEHRGFIDVPSTMALPQSPERAVLEQRAIRSWLCVPLWHAGRRIGLLGFDAVRREKRWPDDDIALLRMAGEIFANALERERAEREKEALEGRLRQAQRMEAIGTLAGGIAHDFNNVLGAILGYAEMALARLPKGSGSRPHVAEVMRAGERAKDVVDQILTFSRRAEHARRPVRMQPLLEEAVGLLRAALPATVEIRVSIQAEDAVVLGDPTQVQRTVMNLCTNAAQAMAAHGAVAVALDTIGTTAEQMLSHGTLAAGRYVRLTVNDTGRGMDKATLERIFEPFFTTKAAGTGLGLATVHGIVAEHGGALNVRSEPGRGSTFEAYFLRAATGADEAAAEAPVPVGHGETILLVDDEKPLVLLGEEILAALGYEPVGFDSSTLALAAFRADPCRFDLVLADEVMSEMSGTQLAAAVHRLRPELPIILMTGHGGPLKARGLPAAGICEVLRKPLLSAAIAKALARHLVGAGAVRNR